MNKLLRGKEEEKKEREIRTLMSRMKRSRERLVLKIMDTVK
jgi:hypothetical protein